MISPIRTEFENFLSFKDKQIFNYQRNGIHYIYGVDYDSLTSSTWSRESYNVGVGKSTLAMVAQYAFYGKVQKKINKDKIINKEAGRDLRVVFEFMINDTTYKIKRYRKHKIHRSNVYLLQWIESEEKWKDISGIDNEATQEEINRLIAIDINTYEKSALITREDRNQFLELPTLNRGYIFENLSQLQKLKSYYDKAKKKIKPIEESIELINNRIIELVTIIKRDAKYIGDLRQQYVDDINRCESEIQTLEQKMQKVMDLGIPVEEIMKVISEYKSIKLESEVNIKEMDSAKEAYRSYSQLKSASDEALSVIENDLNKTKKRLETHAPTTCHNCGAIQNKEDYDKEHKRIEKVIDQLNQRMFQEHEANVKHIGSLLNVKRLIDDLEAANKILSERMNSLPLIKEELMEDIEQLQKKLDEKITELANIKEPDIQKLKDEIKLYKQELDDKKIQKNLLLQEKDMVDFWIDALDFKNEASIKQYIISKLIPVFNNLLQQNLETVYNGAMIVTFDNMFNETIIYNGQSYEYDELSTGEKTKLNFCINFSIFDLTRINFDGCSVVFLDEIFVHVDPSTIQTFISMIKNKYAASSAVYVISHSEIVKDLCEPQTIIRIEKKDNASTIILE